MIFRPDLVAAILAGAKTVTRRRSDRYVVGRTYAVQPGRGMKGVCRVLITGVESEPEFAGRVTDAEAHREGALHAADFLRIWNEIHGEEPVDVFRIEFELVPAFDVDRCTCDGEHMGDGSAADQHCGPCPLAVTEPVCSCPDDDIPWCSCGAIPVFQGRS